MAEATRKQDKILLNGPFLRSSSGPSITSSIKYDRDELHKKLKALWAKMGAWNHKSEMSEKCRTLPLEPTTINSSSNCCPPSDSDGSFSKVEATDAAGSGDEKEVQYAVQKTAKCDQAWYKEGQDGDNKYIHHIHPLYRLNAMPYYAVIDSIGYGCFPRDRDSATGNGSYDREPVNTAKRVSSYQPLRPVPSSITLKDLSKIRAQALRAISGNTTNKESNSWAAPQYYLQFTDHFRKLIEKRVTRSGEWSMLLEALKEIFRVEMVGLSRPLSFSTIIHSRLDKLLNSIIHHPKKDKLILQADFNYLLHLALGIKTGWHNRFKENLLNIDEIRLSFMVTHGILNHVSIKPCIKGDGSASWVAEKQWHGAGTCLLDFPLGHWWPNAECAVRDGAERDLRAIFTENRTTYGYKPVVYIFLLIGEEAFDEKSGWMKYVLEDELENLFLHLQFKVGTNIRLLRGYKLRSHNAPKFGVRYDGVHTLKQFETHVLDVEKRQHRMVIYYVPVKDESGINNNELMKPSTRDDWMIYKKFEKAEMKKQCSQSGYYAWKTREKQN